MESVLVAIYHYTKHSRLHVLYFATHLRPVPNFLRHPHKRIQRLQPRHLKPSLPCNPYRVTQNNLDLHALPAFPINRHTGLTAARVPMRTFYNLLWCCKILRHGLAQNLGRCFQDLGHDAFQMPLNFWVGGHGVVRRAQGQHRAGVHRSVDGYLVPADELQLGVSVGRRVFDPAFLQQGDEGVVLCRGARVRGFGAARVEVRQVWPAVYPCPFVMLDFPGFGLRARRYRDC